MPNAIKVANALIDENRRDGGAGLTPMQLIKLAYIAHGWSFVFLNRPLLEEEIQAWQYGPVVPSLYQAVRDYRSKPIQNHLWGDPDPRPLDGRQRELIRAVYERYRHLTGTQLSALTHMPNTPWANVWERWGRNAIIPNESIAEHYRRRYEEMTPA